MRRPAFLCRILFVGDPALGERQRPVIAPISLDRTPHIEAIAPHPRTSLVPPAPARAKKMPATFIPSSRCLEDHPPDVWRTILQMSGGPSSRCLEDRSAPAPSRRSAKKDRSRRTAIALLRRAFPPALLTLARVRLQRLSPIGDRRNRPAAAENAPNFFPSNTRAAKAIATLGRVDSPQKVLRRA